MPQVRVVGAREVAFSLRAKGEGVPLAARKIVRHYGQLLVTLIQAKASGRPGPNAPTGDYRRSWNVQFSGNKQHSTANVGTNAPQGRRLEFGFHGVDSLGRRYNQPPFPHVGPALDQIEPQFLGALETMVSDDSP